MHARHQPNRPQSRRWHEKVLIAASLAIIVAIAAVTISRPGRSADTSASMSTEPPNALISTLTAPEALPPTTITRAGGNLLRLRAPFDELASSIDGAIGLAVAPIGRAAEISSFGQWTTGPAWSTAKVPVVLAAMLTQALHAPTAEMVAAITASDNEAAERVWASLGNPTVAASKVSALLRDNGDPTLVQSQRVRPEFSAFGQTIWTLVNQVKFLSNIACSPQAKPVIDLMARIDPSQRWGIGNIVGARFKGGWGPSADGGYLVRQIGFITAEKGTIAVALPANPTSGSFADGVGGLDSIAAWISAHLSEFPAGSCA